MWSEARYIPVCNNLPPCVAWTPLKACISACLFICNCPPRGRLRCLIFASNPSTLPWVMLTCWLAAGLKHMVERSIDRQSREQGDEIRSRQSLLRRRNTLLPLDGVTHKRTDHTVLSQPVSISIELYAYLLRSVISLIHYSANWREYERCVSSKCQIRFFHQIRYDWRDILGFLSSWGLAGDSTGRWRDYIHICSGVMCTLLLLWWCPEPLLSLSSRDGPGFHGDGSLDLARSDPFWPQRVTFAL